MKTPSPRRGKFKFINNTESAPGPDNGGFVCHLKNASCSTCAARTVRNGSKSKKRPPTSSEDGDDARRWRKTTPRRGPGSRRPCAPSSARRDLFVSRRLFSARWPPRRRAVSSRCLYDSISWVHMYDVYRVSHKGLVRPSLDHSRFGRTQTGITVWYVCARHRPRYSYKKHCVIPVCAMYSGN